MYPYHHISRDIFEARSELKNCHVATDFFGGSVGCPPKKPTKTPQRTQAVGNFPLGLLPFSMIFGLFVPSINGSKSRTTVPLIPSSSNTVLKGDATMRSYVGAVGRSVVGRKAQG